MTLRAHKKSKQHTQQQTFVMPEAVEMVVMYEFRHLGVQASAVFRHLLCQ